VLRISFASLHLLSGVAVAPTKPQKNAGVDYMVEVKKWIFGDVASLTLRYNS
jgi:hypothetical protein